MTVAVLLLAALAAAGRREESPRPMVMNCEQEFPGVAEAASSARAFVARLVIDPRLRDAAVLVAGELVANAIRHSRSGLPGGTFTVYAEAGTGEGDEAQASIYIEVTDQGGGTIPVVDRELPACAAGGYGLGIVQALATEWDVTSAPDRHVVWSRFYGDWARHGLAAMS